MANIILKIFATSGRVGVTLFMSELQSRYDAMTSQECALPMPPTRSLIESMHEEICYRSSTLDVHHSPVQDFLPMRYWSTFRWLPSSHMYGLSRLSTGVGGSWRLGLLDRHLLPVSHHVLQYRGCIASTDCHSLTRCLWIGWLYMIITTLAIGRENKYLPLSG